MKVIVISKSESRCCYTNGHHPRISLWKWVAKSSYQLYAEFAMLSTNSFLYITVLVWVVLFFLKLGKQNVFIAIF